MKEDCFQVRISLTILKHQMRFKMKFQDLYLFKEHFEKTGKILIVMAFNITKCKEDIFMYETTLIWKF